MKSAAFNIAIVPSRDVAERAMRLSRGLKKRGGLFVLNQRLYSTHITLYMVELPFKNLALAKRRLKKVTSSFKSLRLEPVACHQYRDGFTDVSYRKTATITKLQKTIIEAVSPLREGLLRPKDIARLKTVHGQEKKNIQKYGFRSVGITYQPHLTLTKFRAYNPKATPKTNVRRMTFVVREIGIFYSGEYGTCKKLVTKCSLGKSNQK